ncbi:MAG: TonB family protein, partial [Methylococcales bacterium]
VAQPEKKAPIPPPEPLKLKTAPKIITQKVAEKKLPAITKKTDQTPLPQTSEPQPQPQPQPQLSLEDLRAQIADLGKKIVTREEPGEESSRIKYTNGVSAHKNLAAQYKSDFIQKVERIGSRNFPEAAMKNIAVAHVSIDVGIKADGSIYSIHIKKSSGYPALDMAAKKIVSMSAPFPRLPKALLNELDILVISREWEFSDKSRMSAN